MNFLNLLLAKVSAILLLATTFVWLLRILVDKGKIKQGSKMYGFTKFLQKYHQIMGKLLLLSAVVHGILSSEKLFSFNFGSLTTAAIFLLALSFAFHKDSNDKAWKIVHRLLSLGTFALFVVHVVSIA